MFLNKNRYTRARAWADDHGPNRGRGVASLASRSRAAGGAESMSRV